MSENTLKSFAEEIRKDPGDLTVVSPYPLSQSEMDSLAKDLPVLSKVKVKNTVDPSLLAGLVIKHKSKTLDLSLRKKLEDLKRELTA